MQHRMRVDRLVKSKLPRLLTRPIINYLLKQIARDEEIPRTREQQIKDARLEEWSPDGVVHFPEHPEHYFWRLDRDIPQEQPGYIADNDTRCPRCYSTNVTIRYPTILCNACGFSEPLIDYPISHDFHALLTLYDKRTIIWRDD